MGRSRHQPQRSRWMVPAAVTTAAVVVAAGVYFWQEMEDDNAAGTGFRSEDESEQRELHRGLSSRSVTGPSSIPGTSASATKAANNNNSSSSDSEAGNGGGLVGGITAAGIGAGMKVGKIIRGFFDSSDDEAVRRGKNTASSRSRDTTTATTTTTRSIGRTDVIEGSSANRSYQSDWTRKKVIALVVSANEDIEESLLLHLPTPLDLSRCVLLLFIYSPNVPAPPSLTPLSPRPIPSTPSKYSDAANTTSPAHSVVSNYSAKSFARTQTSPPPLSADSSPSLHPAIRTPVTSGRTSRADELLEMDEDLLSTPTPMNRYGIMSKSRTQSSDGDASIRRRRSAKRTMSGRQIYAATSTDDEEESSDVSDSTLPSLVSKTFGRNFPSHQVLHYSTPTGVVHMLRHLGVSIVFISEMCASVPSATSSEDESTPAPTQLQPPGTTLSVGGGEIIGMLKDWVGEVVLVLDEDEDDSSPTMPSAVSGGEDEYSIRETRKGKERSKAGKPQVGTGRKRKWLDKEKGVGKGITVVDRARFGVMWRAKVEGR